LEPLCGLGGMDSHTHGGHLVSVAEHSVMISTVTSPQIARLAGNDIDSLPCEVFRP
jgi:hypothetical protein